MDQEITPAKVAAGAAMVSCRCPMLLVRRHRSDLDITLLRRLFRPRPYPCPQYDTIAPSSLYLSSLDSRDYSATPPPPFTHSASWPFALALMLGRPCGGAPARDSSSLHYPPTSSDGALQLQHVPGNPCCLSRIPVQTSLLPEPGRLVKSIHPSISGGDGAIPS